MNRDNVTEFTAEWATQEPGATRAVIWRDANNDKWGYTIQDNLDDYLPLQDSKIGRYETRERALERLVNELCAYLAGANRRVLTHMNESTAEWAENSKFNAPIFDKAAFLELRRRIKTIEAKLGIDND